jgi:general stress protein YciG
LQFDSANALPSFTTTAHNTYSGGGTTVAKEDRGFASMDRAKQREIASKGGKAAHAQGTAHEWSSEEAREAGRKGGLAARGRRSARDGFSDERPPDPRMGEPVQ